MQYKTKNKKKVLKVAI